MASRFAPSAGNQPSLAVLALACLLAGSAPLMRPTPPSPPPQRTLPPTPGQAPLRQAIPVEVVRIVDGDTVVVRATIWLDQQITTKVRLRGIDAPEMGARCPEEARQAAQSAEALARLLAGKALFLMEIGQDKYGGRVLGRLVTRDGIDAADAMRSAGHARAYAGGRRMGWCG